MGRGTNMAENQCAGGLLLLWWFRRPPTRMRCVGKDRATFWQRLKRRMSLLFICEQRRSRSIVTRARGGRYSVLWHNSAKRSQRMAANVMLIRQNAIGPSLLNVFVARNPISGRKKGSQRVFFLQKKARKKLRSSEKSNASFCFSTTVTSWWRPTSSGSNGRDRNRSSLFRAHARQLH